jgi:hypothetical protein
VVKIDVEGTEDVVLEHAQALLAANRPDIICEVVPGMADTEAIQAALAPHGYRSFRLGDHVLTEYTELDPSIPYRDWLFTTKTDDALTRLAIPFGDEA